MAEWRLPDVEIAENTGAGVVSTFTSTGSIVISFEGWSPHGIYWQEMKTRSLPFVQREQGPAALPAH